MSFKVKSQILILILHFHLPWAIVINSKQWTLFLFSSALLLQVMLHYSSKIYGNTQSIRKTNLTILTISSMNIKKRHLLENKTSGCCPYP